MTLPRSLLTAILDVTDGDEAEAERLARRWQAARAKADATAERIRADQSWRQCSCELPTVTADDGRCSRCWGRLS